MIDFEFSIPKSKAEIPILVVAGILCFVGWAFHFGFFSWTGGFIYLAIVLPLLIVFYFKLRGQYFVKVNKDGISWRQNIISRFIYIPWNYLQRVDYLEYEINFMLKETAQVVSFATSGLSDDQTLELKQAISDALGTKPI
ncbi:MAG: hypothetical protein IT244_04350 [Bacteroidia bacterium]|nr:hypothetical protein [Bacteroidia bacterium]